MARMNREQRAYAFAKAKVEALNAELEENEREFMREYGYRNADGSIPEHMYMYDNDDKFDQCCIEFEASRYNIYPYIRDAEADLIKAEDALIDFALAQMPACFKAQRDILDRNRKSPKVRQGLIDTAFHLDTSTLPRKAVRA